MKPPKLSEVSSKYGAPMGRRSYLPADIQVPVKLQMVRLEWVDGDYDRGGAYWGHSINTFIYHAQGYWNEGQDSEEFVEVFVRARNRKEAKIEVRELLPNARFYR